MAIEIGPGITIGAGVVISSSPPPPILMIITESELDLQTESGNDITTE
jgi:hypothetical protein